MILLDTNIVSELMRATPDPAVQHWIARQARARVFVSAITAAELHCGVALLPEGKRRAGLKHAVDAMLSIDFSDRVLPFDEMAAPQYGEIVAARRSAGRPISQADAQIAAIARARGAILATRNVADFVGVGIQIINPWDPTGA